MGNVQLIWTGFRIKVVFRSWLSCVCVVVWCAFNALKWWRSLWKLVCTNRSNSLVPCVWFSHVFTLFHPPLSCTGCVSHSSTLISVCSDNEHGGAHGLPTERSMERHADQPKRASLCVEWEREHSVFVGNSVCSTFAIMAYLCAQIPLQHLASVAWFILNNAEYASPDVVMHACGLICVCTCVCVFPLCGYQTPAPHLSAQQGCYGNDRGPAVVMRTLWIVGRWPWEAGVASSGSEMRCCLWNTQSQTYLIEQKSWSHSAHNALRQVSSGQFSLKKYQDVLHHLCWDMITHVQSPCSRCFSSTIHSFPPANSSYHLVFKYRSYADQQSVGINTQPLIRGWWSSLEGRWWPFPGNKCY